MNSLTMLLSISKQSEMLTRENLAHTFKIEFSSKAKLFEDDLSENTYQKPKMKLSAQ